MLIVAVNSELVAAMLAAGTGPTLPDGARCPTCDGRLGAWPGYARFVRHHGESTRLWVHRSACRACGATHALLPSFLLAYRRDVVQTIGATLVASALGVGAGRLSAITTVPAATVRGWLRRARNPQRAARATLICWLQSLSAPQLARPGPHADALSALLDAIAAVHHAARQRFRPIDHCPFNVASAITNGRLLSPA